MNIRIATITMGLLLLGENGVAQENPNNFHSRHNADSVYNVDQPRQSPAVHQPAKPTGYWEKTWGAIATSEKGGHWVLPSEHRVKPKRSSLHLRIAKLKVERDVGLIWLIATNVLSWCLESSNWG